MFRFDCTFSNFNCTKRVQLYTMYTILRPDLESVASSIPKILKGIKIFKGSRDPEHASFRENFSCEPCHTRPSAKFEEHSFIHSRNIEGVSNLLTDRQIPDTGTIPCTNRGPLQTSEHYPHCVHFVAWQVICARLTQHLPMIHLRLSWRDPWGDGHQTARHGARDRHPFLSQIRSVVSEEI